MAQKTSSPALKLAAVAALCIPTWLFSTNIQAADFEALGELIAAQERLVSMLTAKDDVFSESLVQPPVQLAKLQVSANRFNDAEQTIAKALLATRVTNGLYDEGQLPLLQLDIETTITLSGWSSARDKLQHYTWLLTERFELPVAYLGESVSWLVSAHEQGSFAEAEANRAWHISQATKLYEALIGLSYLETLHDSSLYVRFLYDLTQLYYLEAKAILAGVV
jgi:hypothetical protein